VAKFYITAAIDYSNGDPHLGHALEKVGADCIARYRRLRGDQVHFVLGMDEHGQKVAQTAEEHRMPPQEWVDGISERFESTWQALSCSYDDWIRTTQERHKQSVTHLFSEIQRLNPDDIYMGDYEGLYCVGCEEFKQPNQIVDGHCEEHPTRELVPTKESNHFFRLSRYGDKILELITSGQLTVEPAIRRNEITRLLEDGLIDISISRARFPWGIPFPGAPDYTIYVWFDAVVNYLSATGYPESSYLSLWPANLHVIGKGITRFHCVLWPAMLLSANVVLPEKIWAHGYVQWAGAKVSKSAGVAVNLDDAISRHGPDALRYFLLREVGFEGDGNFTWDRFDERYTADLADGLGNLASRSLAMLGKYRDGRVPEDTPPTSLDDAGDSAIKEYQKAMDSINLRGGVESAWSLVSAANLYVTQTAPWALAKAGEDASLDAALASLARCLYRLCVMVSPFMPGKTDELWHALGQPGEVSGATWDALLQPPVAGAQTEKGESLFPKSTEA
jgi:methionyl-tRNA synthetase